MTKGWGRSLLPLINDYARELGFCAYKDPFTSYIHVEVAQDKIGIPAERIKQKIILNKKLFGFAINDEYFVHPRCLPIILKQCMLAKVKYQLNKPIYI